MNTVRRITKNTLVLFIAQIISMGLGVFYIMYTARYLGAEGFGVLSFALAFTGIFGMYNLLHAKMIQRIQLSALGIARTREEGAALRNAWLVLHFISTITATLMFESLY